MRVDPTEPDTFKEAAEAPTITRIGVEEPEADTAEKYSELAAQREEKVTGSSFSANEADRAEQARVVELNEDEYR